MSWPVVARKDFRDARRSRVLWGTTVVYVLLAGGFAVLYATVPAVRQDLGTTALGYLTLLTAATTLFVSVAAIIVAAGAIAGERDSGSSKLLLGFPHSRRDVVLGKLLGRTAVLGVAILVGLVVSLLLALVLFGAVSLTDYAVFTVLTLVLALVYVGVMTGVSASTRSDGRAMAFGIGVFVAFELLADLLPMAVLFAINGFSIPAGSTVPGWIAFLAVLVPSAAYTNALGWFLGDGTAAAQSLGAAVGGPVPVYLSGWASLGVLTLWLAIPVLLGYRRFNAADL